MALVQQHLLFRAAIPSPASIEQEEGVPTITPTPLQRQGGSENTQTLHVTCQGRLRTVSEFRPLPSPRRRSWVCRVQGQPYPLQVA